MLSFVRTSQAKWNCPLSAASLWTICRRSSFEPEPEQFQWKRSKWSGEKRAELISPNNYELHVLRGAKRWPLDSNVWRSLSATIMMLVGIIENGHFGQWADLGKFPGTRISYNWKTPNVCLVQMISAVFSCLAIVSNTQIFVKIANWKCKHFRLAHMYFWHELVTSDHHSSYWPYHWPGSEATAFKETLESRSRDSVPKSHCRPRVMNYTRPKNLWHWNSMTELTVQVNKTPVEFIGGFFKGRFWIPKLGNLKR